MPRQPHLAPDARNGRTLARSLQAQPVDPAGFDGLRAAAQQPLVDDPLYRRDLRVTGIDLSREMLEKAAERVTNERLPNVDGLLEMDAEAMAFQDGAFDTAVAMFTASVVPNARQLYAEMSRVVRPGGRLLFVNHFAAEAGPRWWVERAMAPLSRVLGWHPDFELSALLDRETAEIESIEPCPPAGLFTLVQLRNGDTLRRALAA